MHLQIIIALLGFLIDPEGGMFFRFMILLILVSQGFGKLITPREIPESLTVSVIVPCSGYHFKHLYPLLQFYQYQTCLPDEIVIALSSVEELNGWEIDALENFSWPFRVKIYRSIGKVSAGLNRNLGSEISTGDIFIYQDADDVPHPQRVELVKHVFENYYVDHLMHNFVYCEQAEPISYDKKLVSVTSFDTYDEIERSPEFFGHIHNGNVCCTRRVYAAIQWEDVRSLEYDLDVQFNRAVYQKFSNTALLPSPLVVYRRELSTFGHYFPHLYPPI